MPGRSAAAVEHAGRDPAAACTPSTTTALVQTPSTTTDQPQVAAQLASASQNLVVQPLTGAGAAAASPSDANQHTGFVVALHMADPGTDAGVQMVRFTVTIDMPGSGSQETPFSFSFSFEVDFNADGTADVSLPTFTIPAPTTTSKTTTADTSASSTSSGASESDGSNSVAPASSTSATGPSAPRSSTLTLVSGADEPTARQPRLLATVHEGSSSSLTLSDTAGAIPAGMDLTFVLYLDSSPVQDSSQPLSATAATASANAGLAIVVEVATTSAPIGTVNVSVQPADAAAAAVTAGATSAAPIATSVPSAPQAALDDGSASAPADHTTKPAPERSSSSVNVAPTATAAPATEILPIDGLPARDVAPGSAEPETLLVPLPVTVPVTEVELSAEAAVEFIRALLSTTTPPVLDNPTLLLTTSGWHHDLGAPTLLLSSPDGEETLEPSAQTRLLLDPEATERDAGDNTSSWVGVGGLLAQAMYLRGLGQMGDATVFDAGADAGQQLPGDPCLPIADLVQRSTENFTRVVRGFFVVFLGREAAAGEENGWVTSLLSGQNEEQVLSAFLATAEYYQRAAASPVSGTGDEKFIRYLYASLLERAANDHEVSAWLRALPSLDRSGVASCLLRSTEFRRLQIAALYRRCLHREAREAELAEWAATPFDVSTIRQFLESKPELFAHSGESA